MENILSLPSAATGLVAGSVELALEGTGNSGPGGVESVFIYNGVYLNIREWIDTFLVTNIEGLADADVRDAREANPGRHGETYFESFYGGRTLTLSGKIRAHNINKLRDMEQGLRQAFNDIDTEKPLIIRNTNFGRDMMISCKKIQPVNIPERQDNFKFERDFQITLRASNPRFLSTSRKTTTSSLFIEDTFSETAQAQFTNLVTNPNFLHPTSALTGWTGVNAALTHAGLATAGSPAGNNYGIATSSAAGDWGFKHGPMAVSAAGVTVWAACYAKQPSGTLRTLEASFEWLTEANAVISTSVVSMGALTNSWAWRKVSAVAPATARKVNVTFQGADATAASEILHLDGAMVVESPNNPGLYFDGNSPLCVWSGDPENSTSLKLRGEVANMITNPKAAANTTGWVSSGLTALTRVASLAGFPEGGDWSFRGQADGNADNGHTLVPVESGKTYTVSVWVNVAAYTGAAKPLLRVYDDLFTVMGSHYYDLIAGGWQRLSITFTATGNASYYVSVQQLDTGTSDMRWTLVSMREGSTYQGYVDGDSSGARWFGTDDGSVTELFEQDGFALGEGSQWTYDEDDPGALVAVGGVLKSRNSVVQKRAYRTQTGYRAANVKGTLKITTPTLTLGGATNTGSIGFLLKRLGPSDYISVQLAYNGADFQIYGLKYDGGAKTVIGTIVTLPALSLNTSYWLEAKVTGNNIEAKVYSADPVQNPAAAQVGTTFTYLLAGADATKYGSGVVGDVGIVVEDFDRQDWKIDDYVQETLDASALVVATLVNEGNFPAEPVFQLAGPMTDPALINETTGQTMSFTGTIPAGETWVIDTPNRTIYNNDPTPVSKFEFLDVTSDWIELDPGTNIIDLDATGLDATRSAPGAAVEGPGITIQYYDTWM